MRRLGYESETVVAHIYDIHSREDYDVLTSELVEGLPFAKHLPRLARRLIEPYVTFAWAIKNFDVFTIYTTGTILRTTPRGIATCSCSIAPGKRSFSSRMEPTCR